MQLQCLLTLHRWQRSGRTIDAKAITRCRKRVFRAWQNCAGSRKNRYHLCGCAAGYNQIGVPAASS